MAFNLVSDRLGCEIEPRLPPERPKPKGGRPRLGDRACLTGIVYVLRAGMPWRLVPAELGCGCGVTCWRRLREWTAAGLWPRIRQKLLEVLGRRGKLEASWVILDSASVRAVLGGPTRGRIRRIGSNNQWQEVGSYDVTNELWPERQNVVAVRVLNTGSEGGLLFGMRVETEDGRTLDLVSDAEWRCIRNGPEDWPTPGCRDDHWPRPRVIGPAGSPPWNLEAHARTARRVRSDTLQIVSEGRPAQWPVPSGEWRLYVFQTYHHPGIDGGVLNYLDRRLAPQFIDVALRPHEEYLGQRMGGPGLHGALFDTEGDYGWNLAWSEDLARSYLRTKGRDIRQWMPLLFDRDVEGRWPKARWDWFDVVSEVYSRGWFGAISDWFCRRGISCSLQVSEGSLALEAYSVGSLLQAHRACTLPSNDALFDTALRPHDFKEVHPVAEFESRRHLCEMPGVAGWTMTPVRLKQCTNAAIT